MSLWFCPNCKMTTGPMPFNRCHQCAAALSWATTAPPTPEAQAEPPKPTIMKIEETELHLDYMPAETISLALAREAQAEPPDCKHEQFSAQVNVQRLEDTGRFIAEITVWCASCNLPFSFTGLPLAISCDRATINIDATQVSLPIDPGPKPIPKCATVPVEMPRRGES